ncbi:MAG: RNA polymerase subunit sigma [Methylocystis sp.]|nr:RNA polymerase subunit sigma [Methylocystis sp.]
MSELSDTSNDRESRWRALMASAQDGDHAAYGELLSDLFPVLRRFVMRRWPNAHDTEDVVQEILVSIHTVRQTYDRRRPFTPWLMTIAARRVADARAMAILPAGQRQAIELIKIQGLSLDEASQVTGKSIGSLKVGIHRAIKAMRQALERNG